MSGLSRRTFLRFCASLACLTAVGVTAGGCGGGGGGGSSGGNGGGGGGGGGGGSLSILAATAGAGASVSNSPQSFSFGTLVTGVSKSGQSVTGDLNYNPWQAVSASSGQVNRGSSFSWNRVGSGSGSSINLVA